MSSSCINLYIFHVHCFVWSEILVVYAQKSLYFGTFSVIIYALFYYRNTFKMDLELKQHFENIFTEQILVRKMIVMN